MHLCIHDIIKQCVYVHVAPGNISWDVVPNYDVKYFYIS